MSTIMSDIYFWSNEHIGELAAIADFNAANEHKKIAKIHGMGWMEPFGGKNKYPWVDQFYVLHDFYHSLYNKFIRPIHPKFFSHPLPER